MSDTYKIVRIYSELHKSGRVIAKGLTLEEAKSHCRKESTHKFNKKGELVWFEGFTKEEN